MRTLLLILITASSLYGQCHTVDECQIQLEQLQIQQIQQQRVQGVAQALMQMQQSLRPQQQPAPTFQPMRNCWMDPGGMHCM